MSLRAGAAYVDIAPRVGSGFDKDLDSAISGPAQRAGERAGGLLGSGIGKAAAVALAAVAVSKVKDIVGTVVEAARESNKVGAQTSAVLASTGGAANVTADQVSKLATAISNKTGVDDEAIQSAENLLLTFTDVRNEVGAGNDVFNQATDVINDMGAALKNGPGANSILVGKALNDPIKGLTALTRVGVSFTDQQKDQIKTMVASGDKLGAQKIILAELRREFGGSAEAMATNADRLSVVWGNLQEDLGNKLIPVIDRVSGFLADRLPGAADAAYGAFDRISKFVADKLVPTISGLYSVFTAPFPAAGLAVEVGKIFGLAEDSGPVDALATALENVGNRLGPLVDIGQGVIDKLSGSVKTALDNSTTDFSNLADNGVTKVANSITNSLATYDKLSAFFRDNRDVIVPVAAGLTAFAGALVTIQQGSKAVNIASGLAGPLVEIVGAAGPWGLLAAAVVAVAVAVGYAYVKVKPFHDAVDKLASAARDLAGQALDKLSTAAEFVGGILGDVGDKLGEWGDSAREGYHAVIDALGPLATWINDNVISTVSAGVELVAAVANRVAQLIGLWVDQLRPIVSAIATIFEVTFKTAAALIGDFIQIAITPLGIAFDALQLVVKVAFALVQAIIETVLGTIRGIFEVFTGLLNGDWSTLWEGLKTIVEAPLTATAGFIGTTLDGIVDFVSGLPARIATAAVGMWDGLTGALVDVLNGIIDLWNAVDFSISISVPDWVPIIGGDSWDSGDIFPDIPNIGGGGHDASTYGTDGGGGGAGHMLRDKGGSVNPNRPYLIGAYPWGGQGVTEMMFPGRGHIASQDAIVSALDQRGGSPWPDVAMHNTFEGVPVEEALEIASTKLAWKLAGVAP